ncbi:MAG: hypothetical protein PVJ75_10195, partial [Chloroflexota bacterium]
AHLYGAKAGCHLLCSPVSQKAVCFGDCCTTWDIIHTSIGPQRQVVVFALYSRGAPEYTP